MQIRTIHPFPARMAPELALQALEALGPGSVVLDPMSGSGTVIRHAQELGHRAIGLDVDPLAVLMSKVWTSTIPRDIVQLELSSAVDEAFSLDLRTTKRGSFDADTETRNFVAYWFAAPQLQDLKRISYVLARRRLTARKQSRIDALDLLALGLSKIIVTKDSGASLARDTSHSRPHRVSDSSTFDVFSGFRRSAESLIDRVCDRQPKFGARVNMGDARRTKLRGCSVDAVVTSPPYLNAIDYLRGHRLALVWLGHSIPGLRLIRSQSIGAERAADDPLVKSVLKVRCAMSRSQGLPPRTEAALGRYATDLTKMTTETYRVLKHGGRATFVVGDSCLQDSFINNSQGVRVAARMAGLRHVETRIRELPAASRYLPVTATGALSKRMRTENICTFEKP